MAKKQKTKLWENINFALEMNLWINLLAVQLLCKFIGQINYETQKSSDIELDTTTQAEPCTLAFQQTVEKKYVLNTIKMSPQ